MPSPRETIGAPRGDVDATHRGTDSRARALAMGNGARSWRT